MTDPDPPALRYCAECSAEFLTRDDEERCCRSCRAKDDNEQAAWNRYHEEGVR